MFINPTPDVDPLFQNITWLRVTDEKSMKSLEIGEDLRALRNYRSEYIKFWDRLYEKYTQKPYNV
ncbi:hypothetical protein NQ314_008632 [Rhamnusium bicolor]|uniref:Uncharacterized protein n=1 Tax=Rhamnusium bicolor TaxID=1586634 RepID=A0AAV8Y768_9CUCU|nr:hypothetical protein NQ314_008632 [Rhamnusium bicolor]